MPKCEDLHYFYLQTRYLFHLGSDQMCSKSLLLAAKNKSLEYDIFNGMFDYTFNCIF
jgi:hypothetical protein